MFLIFISSSFWPEVGKSTVQRDFQTWVNLKVLGDLHSSNKQLNHLKYEIEGQERFGDDSSRFTQTLVRSGLGYAVTKNTSLWLGYVWVHTGLPLTMRSFEEDRIWEQLLWTKKNQYLVFTSRTRLEQRFIENRPKVAYRARQLIKIAIPFKRYTKLSFVNSDELFWHKNDFLGRNGRGFDQNRFFIGLGYQINSALSTEIGYLNQYVRRFGVPNFLANALQINLNLSIYEALDET
ncbi:MAG: DUF2490 domain-containing protein [Tatlockia sp.]|nr:DUF2490 domain-containing protein [Tatlockia sp.]